LSETVERPLVVASLTEPPSPDGEAIRRLAGRADWLEVRADLVGEVDPDWLRQSFPGRLLYTLRSRAEGGRFSAARGRRQDRLVSAAARFDLLDLEGDRDLTPELLDAVPAERRIVSWHGAAADLASLRGRFDHFAKTPAAHYKLVPRAASPGDELPTLVLLRDLRRDDVTLFAAGESAAWTRVVAPHLGSRLLYGSATESPAAPGQLSIDRLERDWGLPSLRPISRLMGVVGAPALHSLSPRLHSAAHRALGIDALYVPFEAEHFGDFWIEIVESEVLGRLGLPLVGLSVTSPHKQVAHAVAGADSPLANRLQAVNTLVLRRGVWEGESTDAEGVVRAIEARGIDPRGRRTAVVGCGGAGRAAALALALAGAEVAIVNRGEERGVEAARALGLPFVLLADLDPSRFDLFVHATPLGRDEEDETVLPVAGLSQDAVVVDLVYRDGPTRLLVEATERGLAVVDGREVLLHQAIPQFRLMTGADLPVDLGRRALGLEEA